MRTLFLLPLFFVTACAQILPAVDTQASSPVTDEQLEERGSGPAWVDAPPAVTPHVPESGCTNDQHPERVNRRHHNARPDEVLRLDNPGTALPAEGWRRPQAMPQENAAAQSAWLHTLRELEGQYDDGEQLDRVVAEAKARHFEGER